MGLGWQFSPQVAPLLFQETRTRVATHRALVLGIWPAQRRRVSSCLCFKLYVVRPSRPLLSLCFEPGKQSQLLSLVLPWGRKGGLSQVLS